MELKIDSDKVLKVANDHPESKPMLKTLFPEVFDKTYKTGNIFLLTLHPSHKEYECILSQTGMRMMCFICLQDGNRWLDPIEVKDILNVTEKELDRMAGTSKWEFLRKSITM